MNITPFRKILIGILGSTVVLIGLVGLVLPFLPGWLLIIAGLALLSTEYVWAKRLSDGARRARHDADPAPRSERRPRRLNPRLGSSG